MEVMRLLYRRLGQEAFNRALDPEQRTESPVRHHSSGGWLKRCNTVGINVRTIGSFWNIVKYAITLPGHIRGIHLLPIWEPGVVGSLYGMASWELNPEFLDREAVWMFPQLRGLDAQLRVVVNLLHALGKTVGMDVIPHTDRYSQMVLANPAHFEWLRRDELRIIDHRAHLHQAAEAAIVDWLNAPSPSRRHTVNEIFREMGEAERLRLLFGDPTDYDGRRERRVSLVDWLYHRGLEPVPATMAPPYRGLEVDPDPDALTVDRAGRRWRDYRITRPTAMSRVFGPLTRFKFYERQDDNRDWAIDFDRPRVEVWDYFTRHYSDIQRRYGFDFMRGDMSHVQMRPEGVPGVIDDYYDPLRAVKRKIGQREPSFAYFAESFLAEPGHMAYGDEIEHLTASEAEVTLGNLQSLSTDEPTFGKELTRYLEIERTSDVTPAFTAITGDKDDPRFDRFHHHGEVARLFTGLFLPQLPLYYSLGWEQRDRHYDAAPNEYYTKLYVFREEDGPKSVSGPWRWGGNLDLFAAFQWVHRFADGSLSHMGEDAGAVQLLENGLAAWCRVDTYGDGIFLFLVNFSRGTLVGRLELSVPDGGADLLFSWPEARYHQLTVRGGLLDAGELSGGTVRCYRLR
jgi:hypothetical protein